MHWIHKTSKHLIQQLPPPSLYCAECTPAVLSEPESVGLLFMNQGTEPAMHSVPTLKQGPECVLDKRIHTVSAKVKRVMIHKATSWGNVGCLKLAWKGTLYLRMCCQSTLLNKGIKNLRIHFRALIACKIALRLRFWRFFRLISQNVTQRLMIIKTIWMFLS